MTTITAQIIADSISPDKIRLTTMLLRYPRFIHAELMTHRVFSRNASSSRAIPVEKTIKAILEDTAMPIHWGKNQKGMQADEECNEKVDDGFDGCSRETAWLWARDNAIEVAQAFHKAGYHKQIVNRLLEPFSHINVVVTSTYWANWYKLRDHPMAMPEIQILAQVMAVNQENSIPKELQPGQWHLPFINNEDFKEHYLDLKAIHNHGGQEADFYHSFNPEEILLNDKIKCSVARCARTSYLTIEGKKPDIEADLKLYERLVGSEPLHASPCEHQATPDERYWAKPEIWMHRSQHGNLFGWRQYRKMLKGEFENEYNPDPVAESERLPWGFVI